MYVSRLLTTVFQQARAGFPAILVTGPRQSGKTTFLRYEAGAQVKYVSFDDPLERSFASTDPLGFLDQFAGAPVILDEIQYVSTLLPYLKMRIDQAPDQCGQWLLTGSQQFGLMRDVSESLAGRVAILELPPFMYAEFALPSLEDVIWNGGYPIPAMYPDRRDLWLKSYVATYLERDVRQIRNVPDLKVFNQFLHLAAARHSQEFHPADLSRELGLSQPTIKSWAGVLDASYVGLFLPPWFRNYGKRVVKTPKFYFFDSAIVNLLTRQPDAGSAISGAMGGALLEGWVVTEAAKAFMALGQKPDLYFWRSHDGLEVDLLIMMNGKLQAVEIKLTATPSTSHATPMQRFIAAAGHEAFDTGIVVCQTETLRTLPQGHVAMPWQMFPGWLQSRMAK